MVQELLAHLKLEKVDEFESLFEQLAHRLEMIHDVPDPLLTKKPSMNEYQVPRHRPSYGSPQKSTPEIVNVETLKRVLSQEEEELRDESPVQENSQASAEPRVNLILSGITTAYGSPKPEIESPTETLELEWLTAKARTLSKKNGDSILSRSNSKSRKTRLKEPSIFDIQDE